VDPAAWKRHLVDYVRKLRQAEPHGPASDLSGMQRAKKKKPLFHKVKAKEVAQAPKPRLGRVRSEKHVAPTLLSHDTRIDGLRFSRAANILCT
jgi:hypothetical protein